MEEINRTALRWKGASTLQMLVLILPSAYARRFPRRETAGISAPSGTNPSFRGCAELARAIRQRLVRASEPEENTISVPFGIQTAALLYCSPVSAAFSGSPFGTYPSARGRRQISDLKPLWRVKARMCPSGETSGSTSFIVRAGGLVSLRVSPLSTERSNRPCPPSVVFDSENASHLESGVQARWELPDSPNFRSCPPA